MVIFWKDQLDKSNLSRIFSKILPRPIVPKINPGKLCLMAAWLVAISWFPAWSLEEPWLTPFTLIPFLLAFLFYSKSIRRAGYQDKSRSIFLEGSEIVEGGEGDRYVEEIDFQSFEDSIGLFKQQIGNIRDGFIYNGMHAIKESKYMWAYHNYLSANNLGASLTTISGLLLSVSLMEKETGATVSHGTFINWAREGIKMLEESTGLNPTRWIANEQRHLFSRLKEIEDHEDFEERVKQIMIENYYK